MRAPRFVLALTLVAAVAGCTSATDPAADAPTQVRLEDGDVPTLITLDSATRDPAVLVEEVSIGVAEGDDAYLLGLITSIAASDDAIYLVDMQTTNIRMYDMDGEHIRDIGGEGMGPGEFRRPFDAGFTNDGLLVLRDQVQRRTHVFSPDGELVDDWLNDRGSKAVIGDDGAVYVIRDQIFANEEGRVTAMVRRYGPDGEAGEWVEFSDREPTPVVETGGNQLELMAVFLGIGADWRTTRFVPFEPRVVIEVGSDGSMISGRGHAHTASLADGGETLNHYQLDIQRPDGTHLRVGKEWTPVEIDADEADWTRRRLTAQWRAATSPEWAWTGTDIPRQKGAFLAVFPTHDGRIWVVSEAAGEPVPNCNASPEDYYGFDEAPCWQQPYVADIFTLDGDFLGAVDLPAGLKLHVRPHIDGDRVIALVEDAYGVARVKRYRVEPAG